MKEKGCIPVSKVTSRMPEDLEIQEYLLAICNELMRKNKVIKLNKLYNLARKELSVDSRLILNGIRKLEEDLIIRPNSRLIRTELLRNSTRRELYMLVRQKPGLTFNQIRNEIGKGTKVLLWHIEILKAFGCIFARSFDEKSNAYYINDFLDNVEWPDDALYLFYIYHKKRIKKVLDILSSGNEYSIREIADYLGLSRQSLEYQVKKLVKARIIDSIIDEGSGRIRKYFMDAFKRRVYNKIKKYLLNL
ncbi:MAG: ArsR family transcriptional regulator [Promethearchaeota archaeon]